MESAVGMQLRSKPPLLIPLYRVPLCTAPSGQCQVLLVGMPGCHAETAGRQAAGRLEVCANLSAAKAGIVNILGSLELVMLRQLHTAMIRYTEHN